MQGREEIFCDEASRMEMFRRILYRRMLPLLILIVGAFLPLSLMELLDAASAADALARGIPARAWWWCCISQCSRNACYNTFTCTKGVSAGALQPRLPRADRACALLCAP